MRLSKALKEKNKLTSEIAKLSGLIRSKNSYRVSDESEILSNFNTFDLLNKYRELVSDLVELKKIIAKYNEQIQDKIFLMSELKSEIQMLRGVSLEKGLVSLGYQGNMIEKSVQMTEPYVLEQIKLLEDKIEVLQEEIDLYNYSTEIPWEK